MDRAEGVLLIAELALKEARSTSARIDGITSAPIAKSFVVSTSGELVVIYDDGTTSSIGNVKGKDGQIGPAGRSITSGKINENGYLILSFTDGISEDVGKVITEGQKGEDGVGIDDIKITSSQELEISLTNGKTFNLGKIKGDRGEIGPQGIVGPIGKNGKDGLSIKGSEGLRGEIGPMGLQGPMGMPGRDGKDANEIEMGGMFAAELNVGNLSKIKMRELMVDGNVVRVLVLE